MTISATLEDVNDIKLLKVNWQGNAASGTLTAYTVASSIINPLRGKWQILMAQTMPSTPAPTADYDITVVNDLGVDVFGSELTNRSATLGQQCVPKIGNTYGPVPITSELTINISGTTATNAIGSLYIYFGRTVGEEAK